jgi:hypothetical protein
MIFDDRASMVNQFFVVVVVVLHMLFFCLRAFLAFSLALPSHSRMTFSLGISTTVVWTSFLTVLIFSWLL